jgi:TatA/E family protein of Tat protein translocase
MPNLGFSEILILLLIVALLFGAKRIPEIGASIGKGIKEFKRGLKDAGSSEPPPPPAVPPASASSGERPKRLTQ